MSPRRYSTTLADRAGVDQVDGDDVVPVFGELGDDERTDPARGSCYGNDHLNVPFDSNSSIQPPAIAATPKSAAAAPISWWRTSDSPSIVNASTTVTTG